MKKATWPLLGLILMAALTAIQAAMANGSPIGADEWVQVLIQGVMAFNVWATANLPQYDRMKTWVAATLAVLQVLVTVIDGGVSTAEYINLGITFLAAVGVAVTPQARTTVVNGRTVTPNDPARLEG